MKVPGRTESKDYEELTGQKQTRNGMDRFPWPPRDAFIYLAVLLPGMGTVMELVHVTEHGPCHQKTRVHQGSHYRNARVQANHCPTDHVHDCQGMGEPQCIRGSHTRLSGSGLWQDFLCKPELSNSSMSLICNSNFLVATTTKVKNR